MVGPNGNKCKAIGNKNVSPPSKKKSVPGRKTSCPGKAAAKSPARGNNQKGCPLRKITENMVSPQASPVQDERVSPVPSVAAMSPLASVGTSPAQSTVQSIAAVSPLASMGTSPIQSMAVPHLASLAAVLKKMMDAAQVDGTIAPTMDEIEAKCEHRHAALDRPASPGLATHPQEAWS